MPRTLGLEPRIGFYHDRHGRHAALASDLIEPFRHIVERTVWAMLHRRQFQPDDFQFTAEHGCRIATAARKRYLAQLTASLHKPVASAERDSRSPVDFLRLKGIRLRGADEAPWYHRLR